MKRSLIAISILMTFMLACLLSTVVGAAASGSYEATHATVEGLPAQVTSAVVREQEGKFTLTGSYTVDPAAGARLISFHAFAFSANWLEPRGAGWEQVVDTNAGAPHLPACLNLSTLARRPCVGDYPTTCREKGNLALAEP